MKLLLIFFCLQIADIATTILALYLGGAEKNPLVHSVMMGTGTINGLIIVKLFVLAIASLGALAGKFRGIRVANFAFAAIVAWNLSIICRLLIA